MAIRDMFKIVVRWWWLIAIPIVIVAGHAVLTFQRPATQYQVVMRFATGTDPAGLSEDYDRYYPWLTSEYVARGLADVAITGVFAEAVTSRVSEQGLTLDSGAIQGSIVSDYLQSIFVIYVTWPDADQIVQLADAVTAELTENASTYYPQTKDVGIVARRLDAPHPAPVAPSLRAQLLTPALRLAIAGAAGLGLATLMHYFDPAIREKDDLEAVGIRILARIPR